MEPQVNVDPKKKKPRASQTDKAFVVLNKEVTTKVKERLEEANGYLRGVQITRADFVCWLLDSALDSLDKEGFQSLKAKFQSEEGRLKWALEELKRRREAGESPTLEEILKGDLPTSAPAKRLRGKKPNATQINQIKTGDQNEKDIKNESPQDNLFSEASSPPDNGDT
jgi:hypothetical protein